MEATTEQVRDQRHAALDALGRIVAADTIAPIAAAARDGLVAVLGCRRCTLIQPRGDVLAPLGSSAPATLLEAEVAAIATVLRNGAPRFITQSTAALESGEAQPAAEAVTVLALPLSAAGNVVAVVACSWPSALAPPAAELLVLARTIAATAGLAVSHLALSERLEQIGETDAVTGVQTRRSLVELLGAMRANGTPHALVLLDIDGFAAYNERAGAGAGDRLLVALAGTVATECREGDMLARAGADELALVLPGAGAVDAEAAARRLVHAVRDWGHEDGVTASAGVAAAAGDEPADVLSLAGRALAQAKRAGLGCVAVA